MQPHVARMAQEDYLERLGVGPVMSGCPCLPVALFAVLRMPEPASGTLGRPLPQGSPASLPAPVAAIPGPIRPGVYLKPEEKRDS